MTSSQPGTRDVPPPTVGYLTLPHRGQIFLLALVRLAEPIQNQSIGPYLYFLIQFFGYNDPVTISRYGTICISSYAFGQIFTGIIWGRLADRIGRKPVVMIGLLSTCIASLGFGFSRNLVSAVIWRVLAGMLSGNVGVLRTMAAELVAGADKSYQQLAFAVLPMAGSIGFIIGPMIGGLLAMPATSYPGLFGDSKLFNNYPFLLPNLLTAVLAILGLLATWLSLDETLESKQGQYDLGRVIAARLLQYRGSNADRGSYRELRNGGEQDDILQTPDEYDYDIADNNHYDDRGKPSSSHTIQMTTVGQRSSHIDSGLRQHMPPIQPRSRIRDALVKPVLLAVTCYFVFLLHASVFNQIFPLFMCTPRMPEKYKSPFVYSGGMGLSTKTAGLISSILGVFATFFQILVFPKVCSRYGNLLCLRWTLPLFAIAYILTPTLSIAADFTPMFLALFLAVLIGGMVIIARCIALPSLMVICTNSAPTRALLATTNGINQTASSLARFLGPLMTGFLYGRGLRIGMVSLAFWVLTLLAFITLFLSLFLKEYDLFSSTSDDEIESRNSSRQESVAVDQDQITSKNHRTESSD